MVLGIISILVGVFVLFRAYNLSVLSLLARAVPPSLICYIVVGICLLASGIMSIVYSSRHNPAFLFRCAIANAMAAVAFVACDAADYWPWAVLCLCAAVYYFVMLWRAERKSANGEQNASA